MSTNRYHGSHNQVAFVGGIKGGPSALHLLPSCHLAEFIDRCEYNHANVWEDTGRVGFSGSVEFTWLSAGSQTQYPSGCAVECWSLLSRSPVEVGKCGRKTSTVGLRLYTA